jgi:hypothetical protein
MKSKGAIRAKLWRENNQDKVKAYREKTKEKKKQYYLDNKEEIMRKWDTYYAKNRIEIQRRKKLARQANHYKEWNTKVKRQYMLVRDKTRKKFPLNGQKCVKCEEMAVHRHHTTKPMVFDKFMFLCEDCHDKIHGRKNFRKSACSSRRTK